MAKIVYFAYFGPNRHSDLRLVEAQLDFGAGQLDEKGFDGFVKHVRDLLLAAGILAPGDVFPPVPLPDEYMGGLASLLAQTALLFQRKAGHRVNYYQVQCTPENHRCTVFVEHEHCDVGLNAMKLAVELLTRKRTQLAEPFKQFCEFAQLRLLPLETEAIIAAARRHGVPCFQLERYPLPHKPGAPGRLKNNALIRLGQGARGRLLEGAFLPEEASDYVKAWLRSAEDRRYLLQSLGVHPAKTQPPGSKKFYVVAIGEKVFAVEDPGNGRFKPVPEVHETVSRLASQIYRKAGNQPVSLILAGDGIDHSLDSGSTRVLDFQLAPDLEAMFSAGTGHTSGALDEVAGCLVNTLFPSPDMARIPTVAITGTNGKTTTSRMLGHILRYAGMKPGLVCTNGIYINGEMISDKDAGSIEGHTRVLVRNDIESAVLETHHRGIYIRGFAFHDCDIAACLNVTEDHLEQGGIETLEELVELKFALVARARKAAILFADNPGSCSMRKRVTAEKLWLVSLDSGVEDLRELAGDRRASFSVVEDIEGSEWLVLYDDGTRIPIMESRHIPATFGGAARFNVSNAMHAATAALEAGVPVDAIRSALARFRAGREQSPGRLNVYDQLPFRVIIDNAHNPDGLSQLMKFVDRQSPAGRKVISFAAPTARVESIYRHMAKAVAGHFDLYFCNDRMPKGNAKPDHFAPILHNELLSCGIDPQKVKLAKHGRDVWKEVFDNCAPGDLLMLLLSPVEFDDADRFIRAYANSARPVS